MTVEARTEELIPLAQGASGRRGFVARSAESVFPPMTLTVRSVSSWGARAGASLRRFVSSTVRARAFRSASLSKSRAGEFSRREPVCIFVYVPIEQRELLE